MHEIKIIVGIVIIVLSFIYVIRNNTSMLDNMMKKSKEEYEKKEALKEKAFDVVDGKADAFDTIVSGAKSATKPISKSFKKNKKESCNKE